MLPHIIYWSFFVSLCQLSGYTWSSMLLQTAERTSSSPNNGEANMYRLKPRRLSCRWKMMGVLVQRAIILPHSLSRWNINNVPNTGNICSKKASDISSTKNVLCTGEAWNRINFSFTFEFYEYNTNILLISLECWIWYDYRQTPINTLIDLTQSPKVIKISMKYFVWGIVSLR